MTGIDNSKLDSTIPTRNSNLCTDHPSIRHEWTEPLTYKHENYAHFISEDCEPTNPIFKLLIATERLDVQDLWGCRPVKGQVLATQHGRHTIYSIVVKRKHVDELE